MCKLCTYEGLVNACPVCKTKMPCSMKYRHSVCNNCLQNQNNIPYTNNNVRIMYYNDKGKLCYRHELSNTLTYVTSEIERYCFIAGCSVYVQKIGKNQIIYQALY